MKKYLLAGITIMSLLVINGCTSKEEKAEKLIEKELSKTLYDFDSYQPIETNVKVAKANMYNDSTCWNKAELLAYGLHEATEYRKQMDEAEEYMDIYYPSYYSSTRSDNKYYKYKEERDEAYAKMKMTYDKCKEIAADLKQKIIDIDTTKVVGWEVMHDFRCKTKGGNSTIGKYRYIMSKDFKTVIIREDMDDEDVRGILASVINGSWDD